ncbi:MAG: flagellar hook-basal body complex protein FliE [Candidatus Dadabacteria bacterium]|nr:MAG: flagellar hook-basal body complex protein FliE [Candidatus Dadabacteria bacterium]
MSIAGISAYKKALSAKEIGDKTKTEQKTKEAEGFGDFLKKAIRDVDALQKEADKKIEGLFTGDANVSTHDAMIALEKADIAFRLMNAVRGKIVRAYQEIIRTQI